MRVKLVISSYTFPSIIMSKRREMAERQSEVFTPEEVFKKIQAVLVDALGVDEEEVVLTADLKANLGMESIDFLDIRFRLEKAFNIKMPRDILEIGILEGSGFEAQQVMHTVEDYRVKLLTKASMPTNEKRVQEEQRRAALAKWNNTEAMSVGRLVQIILQGRWEKGQST